MERVGEHLRVIRTLLDVPDDLLGVELVQAMPDSIHNVIHAPLNRCLQRPVDVWDGLLNESCIQSVGCLKRDLNRDQRQWRAMRNALGERAGQGTDKTCFG